MARHVFVSDVAGRLRAEFRKKRSLANMMKRTLLVAFVAVTISPTFANPIDAGTPCSVAIQAFDSGKRPGEAIAGVPSPQVLEVGNYIMNLMEQLDRQHIDAGKPGIWSNFSDAGKHAIAGSTVANCRLHRRRTIYQAAGFVYRSVREINLQLGIVK
jgi:hypothetical protein